MKKVEMTELTGPDQPEHRGHGYCEICQGLCKFDQFNKPATPLPDPSQLSIPLAGPPGGDPGLMEAAAAAPEPEPLHTPDEALSRLHRYASRWVRSKETPEYGIEMLKRCVADAVNVLLPLVRASREGTGDLQRRHDTLTKLYGRQSVRHDEARLKDKYINELRGAAAFAMSELVAWFHNWNADSFHRMLPDFVRVKDRLKAALESTEAGLPATPPPAAGTPQPAVRSAEQ
jgi:hypothetical protein